MSGTVADYIIISDNSFKVDSTPPVTLAIATDHPVIGKGHRGILMFDLRVENPNNFHLQIILNPQTNQTLVYSETFGSGVLRAIHEVIPMDVLPTSIQFKATGGGTAHVSDVVLFYQHTV